MHSSYLPLIRQLVGGASDAEVGRLAGWVARVAGYNRGSGAISDAVAHDERKLVDLLLADAALLAAHIAIGRSVVDIGSGAGAPGLPLGALRADLRVTLIEPMQKRAAWLRITAGGWRAESPPPPPSPQRGGGAPQIEVVQARGAGVVASGRRFDVAISRATLPPSEWLRLGAALTLPSGARDAASVWVLLARQAAPELPGWRVAEDIHYEWPLTSARRRAVRFEPG